MSLWVPVGVEATEVIQSELYDGSTSITTFVADANQPLYAQTVMAQIVPLNLDGVQEYIFSNADTGGYNGVRFQISATGKWNFGADSAAQGAMPNANGTLALVNGAMSTCAVSWDGGLLSSGIVIYSSLGGAPLALDAHTTDNNGGGSILTANGQYLSVGNRVGGGSARAFDGIVGFVARWNRVLTPGEMELARHFGPLFIPEGLVFCWAGRRDRSRYAAKPSTITNVVNGKAIAAATALRSPLSGYLAITAAGIEGIQPETVSATDSTDAEKIAGGGGTTWEKTQSETASAADTVSAVAVRHVRPASDITAGNWQPSAGASLYATLDEDIPDDNDYDYSGWNPAGDVMEIKFAAPTSTPQVTTDHKVRYRLRGNGSGASATVSLYVGNTLIVSWTHNNLATSMQTFEQTLSGAQASAMAANYADVRLRISAS